MVLLTAGPRSRDRQEWQVRKMFILTKSSTSKKQQVAGETCRESQLPEDAQARGKLRNSGNDVAQAKAAAKTH